MRQPVILIVEDDPALNEFLAFSLRSNDFSVLPAANAAEALNLLRRQAAPVDLLLSDFQLGDGLNGVELADCILREAPGVRVMIVSGTAGSGSLVLQRGWPFLRKPYTAEMVIGEVRRLLAARVGG